VQRSGLDRITTPLARRSAALHTAVAYTSLQLRPGELWNELGTSEQVIKNGCAAYIRIDFERKRGRETRFSSLRGPFVPPLCRRTGIGSALVRAGLDRCKQPGFGAVVVLGHSKYYPRFGFSPSTRFCIGCEYEVPEAVFMVLELLPGYLRGASGTIKYHAAFSNV